MTQTLTWRETLGIGCVLFVSAVLAVGAQSARPNNADPSQTEQVAVDAFRCWRDLERRSVIVGEPFTMTVTCSGVETDTATTVPDESALAPETIDLVPFDVVTGERFADIRDEPYRFFQYRYTLRVLEEDTIGRDVELPALELSYHIERRLEGSAALPGREVRYLLPAETVRVLSLVPEGTSSMRDIAVTSFGVAEDRRFRANLTLLVGAALGLAAVGLVASAGLRARRRRAELAATHDTAVTGHEVVQRALTELTTLQRETGTQPWNQAQTGRALTALRLAAAPVLSRPVAQTTAEPDDTPRDGQLRLRSGMMHRRTHMVSSAVTAASVRGALATDMSLSSRTAGVLQELHDVLQSFTATQYGRSDLAATPEVSHAKLLRRGITAVQGLSALRQSK